MRKLGYIFLFSALLLISGCGSKDAGFDANGHFETEEIKVYAEKPGRLLLFSAESGTMLSRDQVVGQIDTMGIFLMKEKVKLQIDAAMAKIPGIIAQKTVLQKEIEIMDSEVGRISNLIKGGAAPQKQLDDLNNNRLVALAKLKTFDSQVYSVKAEAEVLKSQLKILEDDITRSVIKSPIDGIVLENFVNESEIVSPGRILFSIAPMDKMELKAYVSGSQLNQVRLGQEVKVRIDDGDGYLEYPGKIVWVASEAEFTPKIIQTKDERVNLVYAIKIIVKNDGKIKIGMPGEVIF